MADFKFYCPHCVRHLEVSDEFVGMHVNCPDCGKPIIIPPPPYAKPAAWSVSEKNSTTPEKAAENANVEIIKDTFECTEITSEQSKSEINYEEAPDAPEEIIYEEAPDAPGEIIYEEAPDAPIVVETALAAANDSYNGRIKIKLSEKAMAKAARRAPVKIILPGSGEVPEHKSPKLKLKHPQQ